MTYLKSLNQHLKLKGVKFIKNTEITRIDQRGRIKSVYYKAAYRPLENLKSDPGIDYEDKNINISGTEDCVMAESLLIAAGRKGNTDSLKLHKAGIDTVNSFIHTDDKLRTVRQNIFAIGDVNGKIFTHILQEQKLLI